MAFSYLTKTWTITGEKEFEGGTKLLNPSLKVKQVVLTEDGIFLSIHATENGGIFVHNVNVRMPLLTDETDVDVLVDAAMTHTFPTAVSA